MHRDRIALLLFPMALALGVAVGCTDSDPVTPTGHAGTSGGGAGTSGGGAGTSGGGAGTTAEAGTSGGGAGTTAQAGTSGGGAGTTAAAGTSGGGAGTTAAAGTSGGGAGTAGGGAGTTGGGAGTTATAVVSFATDIYPFIATQCMPCHTKATGQDGGPLDMSSATNAYKSLLGTATPVTGAPAKTDTGCKMLDTKKLRVVPGDPAHSYIYIKISNSDATLMGMNCGPAMPESPPKSNLTLTADQKTKIQSWIMGGAKP